MCVCVCARAQWYLGYILKPNSFITVRYSTDLKNAPKERVTFLLLSLFDAIGLIWKHIAQIGIQFVHGAAPFGPLKHLGVKVCIAYVLTFLNGMDTHT